MLVAGAQFLVIVAGEIDDRDPPACAQHARGLGQRGGGIGGEVQHLMQDHRIETGSREGQIGEVALHQFDAAGGQMLELGAGDAQHFKVLVERDDAVGVRREQLGHAARARADIEQRTQRRIGQGLGQAVFHHGIGAVEGAQFIPLTGMAGEIGLRRCLARLADRGELGAVGLAQGGEGGFVRFGEREQVLHRIDHRPRGFALPQEHPAAFAPAFGETRVAQDADMARDARLALTQHLREFAHGKLHRAEQAGDAQPGRITQSLEDVLDHHGDRSI